MSSIPFVRINRNQEQLYAQSLMTWANMGLPENQWVVKSENDALNLVRSRLRAPDLNRIVDIDYDRAMELRGGGRLDAPEVQAVSDLYRRFYGVGGGSSAAAMAPTPGGLTTVVEESIPASGGRTTSPAVAGVAGVDQNAGSLPLVQSPVPAVDAARAAVANQEALRQAETRAAMKSSLSAPIQREPDPWSGSATVPPPYRPPAPIEPDPWEGAATAPPRAVTAAGSPPAAEPPNVSGGGEGTSTAKGQAAIDRSTAKRGGGANVDAALGAFDLGIGEVTRGGLRRAGAAARANGMKNLGNALFRAGGVARFAAPAAALGGSLLPAAMGAMEGFGEAGAGGALIQGGTAAAGTAAGAAIGTAILPGIGTVIGAGLGGMLASPVGKGLTGLAQSAVEKAQMGDTGMMGGIGRALDIFIDTPFEKEQKALLQQMNSPAMRAIQEQERVRQMKARNDQREQMLLQATLQGYF